MPLSAPFQSAAQTSDLAKPAIIRRRRLAPFSLRLSEEECARLIAEAAGRPLGSYIREKALGAPARRVRRSGFVVEDRAALAQALALLGRSHIANNLNQIAKLANVGSLPVMPDTEAELHAAVAEVRRLLVVALGLQPEGGR
jgi:hypothetical protein